MTPDDTNGDNNSTNPTSGTPTPSEQHSESTNAPAEPTTPTTEHVEGAETTETSEPTPAHEAADAPTTAGPELTAKLTVSGSVSGEIEVAVGTKYGDALKQLTKDASSYTFRSGSKVISEGASITADTMLTSVKKTRAG